jgi:hypothetical protein
MIGKPVPDPSKKKAMGEPGLAMAEDTGGLGYSTPLLW